MNDLRTRLGDIRKRVFFGKEQIPIEYYGTAIGVLVPIEVAAGLAISSSESVSLSGFRDNLTAYWERLQTSLDCIYLTCQGREIAAFVNPKLLEG